MALDEPKDDDSVQDENGFQLIIQQSLLDQTGGLSVDFLTGPLRKGFQIQASSQSGGCSSSGCGPSDCSSGGCAC